MEATKPRVDEPTLTGPPWQPGKAALATKRSSGWGLVRWVRIALAVAMFMAGLVADSVAAYALAALLGMQTLFHSGCCEAACDRDEPRTGEAEPASTGGH